FVEVDFDTDGQRVAVGERRDGFFETAVGEYRRVDAAREVAELLERLLHALACFDEQLAGGFGIGRELLLGEADAHAERDEPGLRSVVQVALDPAELGLLRTDGAGARLLE